MRSADYLCAHKLFDVQTVGVADTTGFLVQGVVQPSSASSPASIQ
jgi:hypothetical protein